MNVTTILGLGLIGYFFYTKLGRLEKSLQQQKEDFDEYLDDQAAESVAPAKKYLKITPEITFSEITGNEWTGIVRWKIENTSSNTTFNITRIKSNLIIDGHISLFVPGNKDSIIRIAPRTTKTICSTWQDKKWFNSSDTQAKDDIRELLRDNIGTNVPCLEADVVVWCRGVGQVEETRYVFEQCHGTVYLTKGAKNYWSNQGEYAGNWED